MKEKTEMLKDYFSIDIREVIFIGIADLIKPSNKGHLGNIYY